MISYQSTSGSQLVVTTFMRWPILSTLVAGSLWAAQYLPEEVTEATKEPCKHVCSNACSLTAGNP